MGRSRCLPEPAALALLLTEAGVSSARGRTSAALAPREGEWVRFDEPRGAPAPSEPPPAPAPASVGGGRASTRPLPEPTDAALSEDVFGSGAHAPGVEVRLEQMVAWVMKTYGATAAFIADLEGLPLVNKGAPEPYVVAVGPLARAQVEIARFVADSPPGTSIVEVDRQGVLEVVWADTAIGRLGVGLVIVEPLPTAAVVRIRRVAALAVASRGDT